MTHAVAEEDTNAVEHLLDVWDLMCDPSTNFDAKLTRLLEIETDAFDLPYGFLTRIDRTAEKQTIETAHGSHDQLQDGEVAPLSESYCRNTIDSSDGVFHVNDARAEGYAGDPAYQRFRLGTYVGARVGNGKTLYGTLCFASSEPRETQLTESERRLITLLAMWVSERRVVQFPCECGVTLSTTSEQNGEAASTVSCSECESAYAVTITQFENVMAQSGEIPDRFK